MRRLLRDIFATIEGISEEDVRDAVSETEYAIQRVITENIEVSLAPRSHSLRRMQHRIAARYHLETKSMGQEPSRHLVIYP
jgi:predicted RNA-binding protein Jag